MATVRRTLGIALVVFVALALFVGGWLTGRLGIGAVVDPASLTDVERHFAERMRDVTLVGSFTVAGREDHAPRPDRYNIVSVEKVGDDLWALAGVASRRRQKKYESPQSTLVPAAKPHASGPSPTAKWAMSAEPRVMAKPA